MLDCTPSYCCCCLLQLLLMNLAGCGLSSNSVEVSLSFGMIGMPARALPALLTSIELISLPHFPQPLFPLSPLYFTTFKMTEGYHSQYDPLNIPITVLPEIKIPIRDPSINLACAYNEHNQVSSSLSLSPFPTPS